MSGRKRDQAPSPIPGEAAGIARLLRDSGQAHVLAGLDSLDAAGKAALLGQFAGFDMDDLSRALARSGHPASTFDAEVVEPLPFVSRKSAGEEIWSEAVRKGASMIASRRVAAFTAAGGQGTRLGFEGPKGAFPIGPVTGRPLFRVFAEGIAAASRKHGASMPWIIMTGEENHESTARFLEENGFFGLEPESVSLVKQGCLPVFDASRKIVMESPSRVMTAPDGHGGFFRAMERSGVFARLEGEGIDTIFYFQVDNPLLCVPDEAFIGFHALRGSKFSTKVVEKISPDEKMGVVCRAGGRVRVVEYMEIGAERARMLDGSGRIVFWAGNVANHVIGLGFAREAAGRSLPLHAARKQGGGGPESPAEVFKMESFIFDALELDPSPLVFKADRRMEFGPVKSADGRDSPEAARLMLTAKYASWIEAAGIAVDRGPDGAPLRPIEISPLTASCAGDLQRIDPALIRAAVGPGGSGVL